MMENLATADALEIAGINRQAWNDALARRYYLEAPRTSQGVARTFDRDDIVALFVADHFTRLGMPATLAWRVAAAVRKELRRGGAGVDKLYVVRTRAGRPHVVTPERPAAEAPAYEIPVRAMRRNIERIVAERFGGRP